MSDKSPDPWEPIVLAKGWMTQAQWDSCRQILADRLKQGTFPSLPEVALSEKFLTADQFTELTSQVKIAMACPACGGRFKVGGKRPESGFSCPKCKGALRPVQGAEPSEQAPAVPAASQTPELLP